MHVHDGCVWPPACLYIFISVQTHQQEVTLLLRKLQAQQYEGYNSQQHD
jgi:hypothetical protein